MQEPKFPLLLQGLAVLDPKFDWRLKKSEYEDPLQVAVDRKESCETWCFPAHRDSLKAKRMKKNEDTPLPTSRGRPESIMQDMMLSGPPRLLGLVVQDPIQKYNYRPVNIDFTNFLVVIKKSLFLDF